MGLAQIGLTVKDVNATAYILPIPGSRARLSSHTVPQPHDLRASKQHCLVILARSLGVNESD